MNLFEISDYMDNLLKIKEIEDKSLNGLQVENSGEIESINICVDTSEELVKSCPENSLIIVHHGLFWGKPLAITGRIYKIIHSLMEKNCALYAAHLPLDSHEELGNNHGFYKLAGWDAFKTEKFDLTSIIEFPEPCSLSELLEVIKNVIGKDITMWDFGKKEIKKLAFISGGAIFMISDVIKKGLDLYITGEPSHCCYWPAKENKINVVFGGHYNTEKIGVNLLAKDLSEKFYIPYKFIDLPTGL
jgi:dinuclear metal center YbgI/SA1388 family protein